MEKSQLEELANTAIVCGLSPQINCDIENAKKCFAIAYTVYRYLENAK